MNRLIPHTSHSSPETLAPRSICCRIEPLHPMSAYFGGPWLELYRYAYELAVEQTTAEALRLRRLGHAKPGMN